MITDKEFLKIWDNKEYSNKEYWLYERLNPDEKIKLFDLLENRKPIIKNIRKNNIKTIIRKIGDLGK